MEISKNLEIIENFNLLSYPIILIDNEKKIVWCNEKTDSLINKNEWKNWLTVFNDSLNKKRIKINNSYYELNISTITIESKNFIVLSLFYISDNKQISELLSEQLTDAVLICNDKITYTNTAFENILDYNKEFFIGKRFNDLLDDDNKAILNKNLDYLTTYNKSKIDFILSIKKQNGKKIWISVKTKAIIENNTPLYISIIKNISSSKTEWN